VIDVQHSPERLDGLIERARRAYPFLTTLSSTEWMPYRALQGDAVDLLECAAPNAMLTVQATNAVRSLFCGR
jgi:hypothetical protein